MGNLFMLSNVDKVILTCLFIAGTVNVIFLWKGRRHINDIMEKIIFGALSFSVILMVIVFFFI
jgi:hypothetical protein